MTIRSLQVIASPRMGGAETTFVRQVQGLRRAGHPAVAVVRKGSALVDAGHQVGIQTWRKWSDAAADAGMTFAAAPERSG